MKILQPIKTVSSDIYGTTARIARAGKNGYKIGKRSAKIYNNRLYGTYNITKSVGKKVAKETTLENLPVVAGAIGMLIPYPLTSVIFYIAGKIIQIGVKSYKTLKNNINLHSTFNNYKN